MSKPTPTTHGTWRVIKGELVDESAVATPIEHTPDAPLIASTDVHEGGPGLPVPAADAPNPPPARGRKSTSKE